NLYPKGSAIGAARYGQRPSRMIKRAMIAGMMSSGASIIDLSELPIPVVQFYAREHPVAGAVHIQMSPLDSRSADIRLFDSNGVVLDKKAERKLENVFFREDIRRVHFYEMGDITYTPDGVDSYIDYGSERIYLIDEQGGVLDHHEALGVIAMLVLKAKPGVLVAPATVPQTIGALVRQLPGSNFVPGKSEPSSLLRAAQQHQARL